MILKLGGNLGKAVKSPTNRANGRFMQLAEYLNNLQVLQDFIEASPINSHFLLSGLGTHNITSHDNLTD